MIFGDIGRFQFGQDGNFLDDIVDIILGIFHVNNLDGDGFSSALINTIRLIKSVMSTRPYPSFSTHPLKTLPKLPPPKMNTNDQQPTLIPPIYGLKGQTHRCMFVWCKWTLDR